MQSEVLEQMLQEMLEAQQKKLLLYAQRIVPQVIADDLLQPCDYPQLEQHPEFRYEEGVLHGIQSVQAAFRSRI